MLRDTWPLDELPTLQISKAHTERPKSNGPDTTLSEKQEFDLEVKVSRSYANINGMRLINFGRSTHMPNMKSIQ